MASKLLLGHKEDLVLLFLKGFGWDKFFLYITAKGC